MKRSLENLMHLKEKSKKVRKVTSTTEKIMKIKKTSKKPSTPTTNHSTPSSSNMKPSPGDSQPQTTPDKKATADNPDENWRVVRFPPIHPRGTARKAALQERECPQGIYYSGDKLVSIAVGDLVVRRRLLEEIEDGKWDDRDVFDGPWKIKAFHTTAKYSMSSLLEKGDMSRRFAKKKMLTTKVKLNFPSIGEWKSQGPAWVEVEKLIPLYDRMPGKLFGLRDIPFNVCLQ
jgi:hypothetical protein